MMTIDGRYPIDFNVPRRLEDLLHMSLSQVDRIMMAYELDSSDSRYHRGGRLDSWSDDYGCGSSKIERLLSLLVLFEFLGAHQLADCLRRSGRGGLGMQRRGSNRLLLTR